VFSILNTPSKVYKLTFGTFETSLNAPFGTFKTFLLQLELWNIQNIKELILFVPKQLDHHLIITIGNFGIS
jgi:hypothetical protein